MDLKKQEWNNADFLELREYLNSLSEEKFRLFNEKIIKTEKKTLGVRIPAVRKIAKEIIKGNPKNFVLNYKPKYHEEKLLLGIVITDIKIDMKTEYEAFIENLENFLPLIDNWAQCDILCSGIKKPIKKYHQEFFEHLQQYLDSDNHWVIRVGIVSMLSEYITEEYIAACFRRIDAVSNTFYYVQMAQAWLVSIAMVKLPEITKEYFSTSQLDNWTFNKAIQKSRESFRVSAEDKAFLLSLKK